MVDFNVQQKGSSTKRADLSLLTSKPAYPALGGLVS